MPLLPSRFGGPPAKSRHSQGRETQPMLKKGLPLMAFALATGPTTAQELIELPVGGLLAGHRIGGGVPRRGYRRRGVGAVRPGEQRGVRWRGAAVRSGSPVRPRHRGGSRWRIPGRVRSAGGWTGRVSQCGGSLRLSRRASRGRRPRSSCLPHLHRRWRVRTHGADGAGGGFRDGDGSAARSRWRSAVHRRGRTDAVDVVFQKRGFRPGRSAYVPPGRAGEPEGRPCQ